MISTDDTRIHGLASHYADDGVEVSYVYPGALEVRIATGVTMPPAARAQQVALGILLADPDDQDPRDDRSWRWPASTNPATRRWAQHVLAADSRTESLVYEHDGELVLVWAFIPGRAAELALLEAGFTPALATWRAPTTPETRTLAAQMAKRSPSAPVFTLGTAPPVPPETDERAHADRVEHAWMRWAACMDTRALMVGKRTYEFRGPPQRDGSTLVLRYRTRDADLQIALDVERHPLIYDVSVGVGGRGASLTPHLIPSVAWQDFPALVEEIGRIIAGKSEQPAKPAAPAIASTRKGRKATPVPTPAPTGPVPLAWGERIAARFNDEPGPRLRLEGRRGQEGLLFVALREGGDVDDVLAAIDIDGHTVEGVRWIATTLRAGEQDAIVERLDRALADDEVHVAATDKESPPDAESSLQPLIRMLERQGLTAYGMDPARAKDSTRQDPLRALALALQDLSADRTASPEAIATWLSDRGLFSVADVLQDATVVAYTAVGDILDRVWGAADDAVPVVKVGRQGDETVVDRRAIAWSKVTASSIVLVREAASGRRYQLRTVKVMLGTCNDETCKVIPIGGKVGPGAEVYLLHERQDMFVQQLHDRLAELEQTLRSAPKLLEDVRHLLFLAGVLIDTQRCQGKEQAAALRAFEQAKGYHDAARRMLVAGKSAVAAERIHAAMRRIAAAAAQIAQSCAAGQQSIVPAKLTVTPDGENALEEPASARSPTKVLTGPVSASISNPSTNAQRAERTTRPSTAFAFASSSLVTVDPATPDVLEILRTAGIHVPPSHARLTGRVGEVRIPDTTQRSAAKTALDRAGIRNTLRAGRIHFSRRTKDTGDTP